METTKMVEEVQEMKFRSIKEMNPAQIIIARIVAPWNIEAIESIIEDKQFGSGTPEQWNKILSDYKAWYRKLLECKNR